MYMERNFENSVFLELRNYKGFSFNPMRLYEIFYDEKSEKRTKAIMNVLLSAQMFEFIEKAKNFAKGPFQSDAFISYYYLDKGLESCVPEIQKLFDNVVKELISKHNEDNPYYSYAYATVIISILFAMPGYFTEESIFKFVYFCRNKHILNI